MSDIKEINFKKTLVYFASGPYKKEYEFLPYDRIYLVDYCFTGKGNRKNGSSNHNIRVSKSGKVICLGMDCLDAVNYLKQHKVKVDGYVVLNEGLFEGNGRIALNSDIVLGHVMPILSNDYIHILNKEYYGRDYRVTLDLPFEKSEIHPGDADYLDPFLFSSDTYHQGHAKVYRMKKKQTSAFELKLNPGMKVSIIHDSIWCHTEELDLLGISFVPQGQGDYFNRINKVTSLREYTIAEVLEHCVHNKLDRIGITPWAQGHYTDFIDLIKSYNKEYPKEISLFHLNTKDFNSLKELA
jgi:hypothetical protein